MQYVWMAVVGLIVGLVAQAIYPGDQETSWLMKMAVGVGGSLLAGTIGNLIHKKPGGPTLGKAGIFYSLLGALVIIFIARRMGFM